MTHITFAHRPQLARAWRLALILLLALLGAAASAQSPERTDQALAARSDDGDDTRSKERFKADVLRRFAFDDVHACCTLTA